MSTRDWIVLVITLLCIIAYGLYKSRTTKNLEGYFLSNRTLPWYLVLLSIMGTQASAVTFLSGPGQAYTDGMRFVQYYFGLPLAMIVLCITFVPIFHKLKVFTAYEFLEKRFDLKTRSLTSFLFLLQRGLSTGISVAAPSIILSALLGWDIFWTNVVMGGLLIIYTVSGGAKAVAYTQQLQLIIIICSMALAGYMVVHLLPEGVGFSDALRISGEAGKLNVITTGATEKGFDWTDKYNIISGVIGGFFLALSYFGTDQSQVGRYLTSKSLSETRISLLMNGLVKIPMQFLILLVGALVFTFYQFHPAPVFFNQSQIEKLNNSKYAAEGKQIVASFDSVNASKKELTANWNSGADHSEINRLQKSADSLRRQYKTLLEKPEVRAETNDTNYIFLRFVIDYLPKGLVGLLIAMIFLAAWGSIAAALNSLASSTMIDFHKRHSKKEISQHQEYRISQWYTLGWGIFCILIAQFATVLGNSLIEAVNILGSLFYGVILGVFLLAFYFKKVRGNAVFWSAVIVEIYIVLSAIWPWLHTQMPGVMDSIPGGIDRFMQSASKIGFLWLNAIGAAGVVVVGLIMQEFYRRERRDTV
ncbi:MAG TPA: sodium:solute symporter [Chitinophagaceae bacterium]|nr:sodium:solute symporter [Chitinophagaceae bacterium]